VFPEKMETIEFDNEDINGAVISNPMFGLDSDDELESESKLLLYLPPLLAASLFI